MYIAGCDNTIIKEQSVIISGIIVLRISHNFDFEIIERVFVKDKITFPYIPGLLSFREIPTLVKGFKKVKTEIGIIYADGQGYAHPRRFGLASHLGVILEKPTIGIAKSKFIGEYEEPGIEKGGLSKLMDKGEQIGFVYRNKKGVKPVFISPGHLIAMDDIVSFIRPVSGDYRIPAPTRIAHIETAKFRKELIESGT